jgi:hypothetical protein
MYTLKLFFWLQTITHIIQIAFMNITFLSVIIFMDEISLFFKGSEVRCYIRPFLKYINVK